jgi:hypothetical protein
MNLGDVMQCHDLCLLTIVFLEIVSLQHHAAEALQLQNVLWLVQVILTGLGPSKGGFRVNGGFDPSSTSAPAVACCVEFVWDTGVVCVGHRGLAGEGSSFVAINGNDMPRT